MPRLLHDAVRNPHQTEPIYWGTRKEAREYMGQMALSLITCFVSQPIRPVSSADTEQIDKGKRSFSHKRNNAENSRCRISNRVSDRCSLNSERRDKNQVGQNNNNETDRGPDKIHPQ